MPEIETYTPAQLETEVQTLAENYRGAVAEIAEDDGYFDDISTAIQGKTGQAEPYAKNEMAGAIANISTIPEKPDPNGALLRPQLVRNRNKLVNNLRTRQNRSGG